MFESFKRERQVRQALRLIAKQRAVIALNPGNVFVVENSPADIGWFRVAVTTAQFRGWADILFDAIPSDQLNWQGGQLISPRADDLTPHYRLTEGGWAVLHRAHAWTVATFVVSLLAFIASIVAVVLAWPSR